MQRNEESPEIYENSQVRAGFVLISPQWKGFRGSSYGLHTGMSSSWSARAAETGSQSKDCECIKMVNA